MMAHTRQPQIDALQQLRHRLLRERETASGHTVVVIDMQLNMVRSELHALYAKKYIADRSVAANDTDPVTVGSLGRSRSSTIGKEKFID